MKMQRQISSEFIKFSLKLPRFNQATRNLYETHYEVLNVPQNCSAKDIRDSFIKLSKEHHPDLNKSRKSHARFLKIKEAYEVLGKDETRRNYDLGLASDGSPTNYTYPNIVYRESMGRNPWDDPSFWANRDKSKDKFYEDQSYYGIKGIRKVSNGVIVVVCMAVTFIGIGIQYFAITNSLTFRRDNLIKKSTEAHESLNEIRNAAHSNGNDVQMQLLKLRLNQTERYK